MTAAADQRAKGGAETTTALRGLSERARVWLVFAAMLALVAAYVLGWMTYAYVHLNSNVRYATVPPGGEVHTRSATIRLVGLSVADSLSTTVRGDPPTAPYPGAVWVVAVTEVTVDPTADHPYCLFDLIGPRDRRWEPDSTGASRQLPSSCTDDSVPKGRPTRIETLFQVPAADADQLLGVAVHDDSTWHRMPLLRP